jgi:predicted secreted Zn-dependent protease
VATTQEVLNHIRKRNVALNLYQDRARQEGSKLPANPLAKEAHKALAAVVPHWFTDQELAHIEKGRIPDDESVNGSTASRLKLDAPDSPPVQEILRDAHEAVYKAEPSWFTDQELSAVGVDRAKLASKPIKTEPTTSASPPPSKTVPGNPVAAPTTAPAALVKAPQASPADWPKIVKDHSQTHGCKLTEAMGAIEKQHPGLREKYLKEINAAHPTAAGPTPQQGGAQTKPRPPASTAQTGDTGHEWPRVVREYQRKHGCKIEKAVDAIETLRPGLRESYLKATNSAPSAAALQAERRQQLDQHEFLRKVRAYSAEHKCKPTEAMDAIDRLHPGLREAYVEAGNAAHQR